MAFQTVFKRYELKYMLTAAQKDEILSAIEPYMELDKYGKTTIRNLYYDTDSYLLIRRSIEKPIYKEKLRIRSYCQAESDSTVFVEIKKKYNHVVYKRRIALPEEKATKWLSGDMPLESQTQISKEIDYFLEHYGNLHPTVFLSYEREAYFAKDGSDFRITFDDNVLSRETDLSLTCGTGGTPILPTGAVLMELKCTGGIPLWMAKILSEKKIYKTSFSKYGTAYRNLIFPEIHKSTNKEIPTYERII